jgi:hypothetical protein
MVYWKGEDQQRVFLWAIYGIPKNNCQCKIDCNKTKTIDRRSYTAVVPLSSTAIIFKDMTI